MCLQRIGYVLVLASMARSTSNFRSNLLDRVGSQRTVPATVSTNSVGNASNAETYKDLLEDSLSNSDEADLEKLRLFALKNELPADQRVFLWKLLLGVLSSMWAVNDELEEDRKEEAEMLFGSLVIMRKIPERRLEELRCAYPDIVYMIRIADPHTPLASTKRCSSPADFALFSVVSRMYKLCTETGAPDAWIDAYWLSSKMNLLLHKEFCTEELMSDAIRVVREHLWHLESEEYEEPIIEVSEVLECSASMPCGEVDRESPPLNASEWGVTDMGAPLRKRSSRDFMDDRRLTWPPGSQKITHGDGVDGGQMIRKRSADSVMMKTHMFKEEEEHPFSSYSVDSTGMRSRAKLISRMKVLDSDRFSRSMDHLIRREGDDETKSDTESENPKLEQSQHPVELSEREFFEGSSDSTTQPDQAPPEQDASSTTDSNSSLERITKNLSGVSLSTSFKEKGEEVKPPFEVRRRHHSHQIQRPRLSQYLQIEIDVSSPDHPGASMEVHHPDMPRDRNIVQEQEANNNHEDAPVEPDVHEAAEDPHVQEDVEDADVQEEAEDADEEAVLFAENPNVSRSLTICNAGEPELPISDSESDVSDLPSVPGYQEDDQENEENDELPELEREPQSRRQSVGGPREEDQGNFVLPLEIVVGEVDVWDVSPSTTANSSPTRRNNSECSPAESPKVPEQPRRPKFKYSPFDGLSDEHIGMWFLCAGSRFLTEESTRRLWDKVCTGERITLLLTTVLVDLLEYAVDRWAEANENEDHKATSVFPVNRYIAPELELKIITNSIENVFKDRKAPAPKDEEQ
uniref:Rab-GAP TBC domain-containing protein n=1 Tax=Steinernema glaseri TaxID=37863 RepID=A0A1I7ZII9_9BILA